LLGPKLIHPPTCKGANEHGNQSERPDDYAQLPFLAALVQNVGWNDGDERGIASEHEMANEHIEYEIDGP
jgi:hypothetical protein